MTKERIFKEVFHIEKEFKKKNVCAYARVSTTSNFQALSFETQVQAYTKQITSNPDYNFVGVYADEGKSGTSTKYRTQFNKMIENAKNGMIDLIITKAISRFARNTIDCLSIIQDLKRANVEVFFEKENISSFDPKIEFIISVLSGMAEEESRIISENVKWGNTKAFENGNHHMVTRNIMGYTKDEFNKVVIDEQEAPIIRKIFSLYIEGHGATHIINYLQDNDIKTVKGNDRWNKSAVFGILGNEKYTGNVLLQKAYKPSFKSKKRVTNDGHIPQYYVVDSHPAIITTNTFNKVQEIRKQKSIKYHKSDIKNLKEVYTKKSPYTGLVQCPYCGKFYRQKIKVNGTSYSKKFLQCSSNSSKKTCKAENISVEVLDRVIINQINLIIEYKTYFIQKLRSRLYKSPDYLSTTIELQETESEVNRLQKQINETEISSNSFHFSLNDELNIQYVEAQIKYSKIKNRLATEFNIDSYISKMMTILKNYDSPITSICDFPYIDFFNMIMPINRNDIRLFTGMNFDIDNVLIKRIPILAGKVPYFLRSKEAIAHFGIFIQI